MSFVFLSFLLFCGGTRTRTRRYVRCAGHEWHREGCPHLGGFFGRGEGQSRCMDLHSVAVRVC